MDNNNWTDFIYIILAAVIGIISKIIKHRNKQTANKKVVPTPEPETHHETMMSEQGMPEEEAVPEKKSKAETIFTSIFDALLEEEAHEAEIKQAEAEILQQTAAIEPVEPVKEKKEYESVLDKKSSGIIFHEDTEEEESDFDLREAVVYSEILNRKYSY